ncbi:MAG: NADAR family protein [Desulfobacterales bacterium]|nr:NADAR family protein [Desulfobacterales bacterium]
MILRKDGRNWFSNFIPFETPVVYQGISYPTPEHFYQAMKANRDDLAARRSVAAAGTPGQAKRAGRAVALRSDWNTVKVDVMRYALEKKFAPGTSQRMLLDNTTEPIVEWNSWHDNYWGYCTCPRCAKKQHLNMLGKLLMEIRDA